jgi:hypothetical protein
MTLGADQAVCRTELVEAMRARLVAEDPALGPNVDLPPVQANFDALGLAIFRIATLHGETHSTAAEDAAFWSWVSAVSAWLAAVGVWQAGMAAAFTAWAPTLPAEQAVRLALTAVPVPGPPPGAPPTSLTGRVR